MSKVKRREFIVGGAAAVVGLTCLSKDLRAALAQAERMGKPLLTEKNLNGFIKANSLQRQKGQILSSDAVRDLDGFVQKHFYLTEAQRREFASLSVEDKKRITNAIDEARAKKGQVTARFVSARASNANLRLREAHHAMPRTKIEITGGYNNDHGWHVVITVSKD
jgi:predicted sulfurtransferase